MGEEVFVENIASHLDKASKLFPDQTAILSAQPSLFEPRSFKELNLETIDCASYLSSQKISKGDTVLLAVKPGYQLILIAFSLFRIGAIPVIIDPGMGVKAFLRCIKSTKPNALIGIPLAHFLSKIFRKSFQSIQKKIVVSNNQFSKELKKNCINDGLSSAKTKPEETAAIVFTSGSTGPPKGVVYSHKMFNAQINHLKNDFGMEEGETDLTTLPIFSLFNPALGITTVIPEMNPRRPALANPRLIVESMRKFKINSAFASPVIGEKIYKFCKNEKIELPDVKRLFLAGAPTHPNLIESLSKIIVKGDVIIPYGATEALPISATNHREVKSLAKETAFGKGSVLGKPLSGTTIRIMPISNAPFESGTNCPKELKQGEVGEICVSGDVVSKEYFRMPGATVDTKFNDGILRFHRMGDLGYFDKKGILRFLGRKAEMFLTKDGPLETERCEPLINSFENISRTALVGIGNTKIKEPCVVLELKNSISKSEEKNLKDKILKTLNHNLPTYTFQYVVVEKTLPVDPRHNAKIHRLSLAKKWTKKIVENRHLF